MNFGSSAHLEPDVRNMCDVIDILNIYTLYIQSSLAIMLSPGGIFWDRGISEARYRFCRQVFFIFNLVYIF